MAIGASFVASNSSPTSGRSPVNNAAIAPTPTKALGLELPSSNDLEARALDETLVGGSATEGAPETRILYPEPITNNAASRILSFDAIRVAGRPAGLKTIPDTGGPSLLSFITGVMLVVCGALELIWVLLKRDS
jgi:hypothetical protein